MQLSTTKAILRIHYVVQNKIVKKTISRKQNLIIWLTDVRSTLRSPLSTTMAPKTAKPETIFVTDALHMRPQQQSTKTVSVAYAHLISAQRKKSKIDPALVYKRIFDAIRAIYDTTAVITPDNRITNSKGIPSGAEYEQMFPGIRTDHITKRMYLSFTLESIHTIS